MADDERFVAQYALRDSGGHSQWVQVMGTDAGTFDMAVETIRKCLDSLEPEYPVIAYRIMPVKS